MLLVLGFVVMGFYWLFYDTAVRTSATTDMLYNTGWMNNRIVGTVVGATMAVVGAIRLRID
jgi:hypothetical protein